MEGTAPAASSTLAVKFCATALVMQSKGSKRSPEYSHKSSRPLWRISTPPSTATKLIGAVARKIDVRVFYDWSGGLIWLETPPRSPMPAP